jgi:hypothetical protein
VPARRRDLLFVHLPAVAWFCVTTLALAAPPDLADLPEWVPRWLRFQMLDKAVHGVLFAVAALLLARSLLRLARVRRPLLTALLMTAGYGLATEVGQHLFTERTGEPADLVADVAGAALGIWPAAWWRRREGPR